MTPAAILAALLQFGPTIIPLISKLVADIKAGKGQTEATPEDWAELNRLASLSAESIYSQLGITPPPPTASTPVVTAS